MVDEAQPASPKNDAARTNAAEDAETRATRRELKQSSISDPSGDGTDRDTEGSEGRPETPADDVTDERNEELKDHISSPKKKRAHDQLDPTKDEEQNDNASVTSADSSKDRASRSEPEKKRHRDADGSAEVTDEVHRFSTPRQQLGSHKTNMTFSTRIRLTRTKLRYRPKKKSPILQRRTIRISRRHPRVHLPRLVSASFLPETRHLPALVARLEADLPHLERHH